MKVRFNYCLPMVCYGRLTLEDKKKAQILQERMILFWVLLQVRAHWTFTLVFAEPIVEHGTCKAPTS